MALVPATNKISELSWSTPADLKAFVDCVWDQVVAIEKSDYSTINHFVAFANAGHEPCSAPVAKFVSRYQELIHDSALTTQAFVTACVRALKKHKMAIMAADKGKTDAAWKMIVKCGDLALRLAKLADGLVQKAAESSALAEEGLVKFDEDRALVNILKADTEALKMITAARSEEISKVEDEMDPYTHWTMPKKLIDLMDELERDEHKDNADLQGKLEKLHGMKVSLNDVEKEVKMLGEVKVTSRNVSEFWSSVSTHCKLLSKGRDDFEDLIDMDEDLKQEIACQAISWAALGKVNMVAHDAMVQLAGSVDALMQNLPVGMEAAALQDDLISRLSKALEDENTDLTLQEAGEPK